MFTKDNYNTGYSGMYPVRKIMKYAHDRKVMYINLWKAYDNGYPDVFISSEKNHKGDLDYARLVMIGFDPYSRNEMYWMDENYESRVYTPMEMRNWDILETLITTARDIIDNHDDFCVHYESQEWAEKRLRKEFKRLGKQFPPRGTGEGWGRCYLGGIVSSCDGLNPKAQWYLDEYAWRCAKDHGYLHTKQDFMDEMYKHKYIDGPRYARDYDLPQHKKYNPNYRPGIGARLKGVLDKINIFKHLKVNVSWKK